MFLGLVKDLSNSIGIDVCRSWEILLGGDVSKLHSKRVKSCDGLEECTHSTTSTSVTSEVVQFETEDLLNLVRLNLKHKKSEIPIDLRYSKVNFWSNFFYN